MKKICLITTGGTIASRRNSETGHTVAGVSGHDLRASLHDPLPDIELEVEEFCNIGSYAFDLPLAFALAARINAKLDGGCDGVVVTHGTDTMEESAYMAELLLRGDKPVVFTGAQRAADQPDTDGPRNIADAVRLAAAPAARGLGAMICFEQEFHAARDVTKTHTSRVDTFMSGEHGKLGEIDAGQVFVHRRPTLRRTYAPAALEPAVELVKLSMGSTDGYLRYAAAHGTKAFVLEGFGLGNAPPAVTAAAVEIVRAGIPVIMTSRCPKGRVKPVYGNGGGRDLADGGVIFAGDLNGPKARILAALLLGLGLDSEALRAEIDYLGG
ncbi:asparaginase [Labrys monachus]|uniref:L-asparaginase n=1 Tax=Labrys monachus TaxID=217067 RepID=A0ABU0FPE9_9HYPH|nr:asparaginase [Labrys monachus]MDQ0396489.1 L-asparaginase [Labrys monachus]